MTINATHVAYSHTCKRKLWLFSYGIQLEHTSATVAKGKIIGEMSYLERAKNI